jgi:hypothetical protein
MDDIVADLNTPRPIVAGGTGASTVQGARDALGISTPFATRAAAIAATIPVTVNAIAVLHNGVWCKYVYNPAGTALTTAGARNWSPVAPVYLEHWGVDGDGLADDTAKVIAATTAGFPIVNASSRKYRLTNQVVLNDVKLIGEGYQFSSMNVSSVADLSGSVFICDFLPATAESMFHLGRGGMIESLMGYSNRQTATRPAAWVPVVTPWFVTSGQFADTSRPGRDEKSGARKVMFLEFTHGLRLRTGGEQGIYEQVYGNPLTVGLEADANYDVTRFIDFHFWPFGGNTNVWQVNERVWTLNNLKAFRFGRVDGLLMRGCFTIGAAQAVEFYPSETTTALVGGATTNFHMTDCYLDANNTSLKVTGTYAAGWRVSGHIVGGTMAHYDNAAEETLVEAENIVIESDFKEIQMVGVRMVASGGNRRGGYGKVTAANGILNMNGCSVNEWDIDALGTPAFVQSGANSAINLGDMQFFAATNTPMNMVGKNILSGRVRVKTNQISWTPTLTFATPGNLSVAYGAVSGAYRLDGDLLNIKCRLVATPTFTTASGALRIGGFPVIPALSATPTEFAVGFLTNVAMGTRYEVAGRYTPGLGYFEFFLTGASATSLAATDITSGTSVSMLFEATVWL